MRIARLFGFEPKVAFLSHSTFGKPLSRNTRHVREAIEKLKEKVDFDFDGEMQPDVALNPIYQEIYPFSKIVGNANVLIMPALHSAAISTKLMKVFGGGKNIEPFIDWFRSTNRSCAFTCKHIGNFKPCIDCSILV